MRGYAILTIAAMAATACQTTQSEVGHAIHVEAGPGGCKIDGQSGSPKSIIDAWVVRNGIPRDVAIFANASTPYRCVGGAIFYLQRHGIKHIRYYQVDE